MAGFEKFEDIQAWKTAKSVALSMYRATMDGPWAKDWGFRDQVRRSSVSVMSNISEGFGRGGDAEFHRFLCIARGSAAELKSQLYLATELDYISNEQFKLLHKDIDDLCRMITGLMQYLKKRKEPQSS